MKLGECLSVPSICVVVQCKCSAFHMLCRGLRKSKLSTDFFFRFWCMVIIQFIFMGLPTFLFSLYAHTIFLNRWCPWSTHFRVSFSEFVDFKLNFPSSCMIFLKVYMLNFHSRLTNIFFVSIGEYSTFWETFCKNVNEKIVIRK